jgi:hypothetical protein
VRTRKPQLPAPTPEHRESHRRQSSNKKASTDLEPSSESLSQSKLLSRLDETLQSVHDRCVELELRCKEQHSELLNMQNTLNQLVEENRTWRAAIRWKIMLNEKAEIEQRPPNKNTFGMDNPADDDNEMSFQL